MNERGSLILYKTLRVDCFVSLLPLVILNYSMNLSMHIRKYF